MSVADSIRADAARVLQEGRAKLVIGYRQRDDRRVPVLVTDAAAVNVLTYDSLCRQNLAAYLRKDEVKRLRPVAVVARPEVMRSLLVLRAESQLTADAVVVLAVGGDEEQYHGVMDLPAVAQLLKERYAGLSPDPKLLEKLAELAAMTPAQRSAFWTDVFSKCTRCHACRAACPGCYCRRCLADRNVPQWMSSAAAGHGNYAWNVMRAYHQAGRCTLCGACEAACPQGLPLMLLNLWIDQHVEEEFGYRCGYDEDAKPLIGSWSGEDNEQFIR